MKPIKVRIKDVANLRYIACWPGLDIISIYSHYYFPKWKVYQAELSWMNVDVSHNQSPTVELGLICENQLLMFEAK